MPQVRRDPNKPFYSAVIKIENTDKFHDVVKKLRFFKLEGYPCRALPYNPELLRSNIGKLDEHNLFVRKIPKTIHSDGLEETFKQFGEIISTKVSIDENHLSKGYGFVSFKEADSATEALSATNSRAETIGVKYAPKSKAEFRKAFNNIFIKNMPDEWTEQDLK
jgi:polyadenylate-binding protein